MTDFPDYIKSTNMAYEILENYRGNLPQIDIVKILNRFDNIKIFSYSQAAKRMKLSITEFLKNFATSEHGFTIVKGKKALIYYNERKDETTVRFTLSHELGHIVLEHKCDNLSTDREANCFARNILCPVPLRKDFGLVSVKDYCSCFDISESMAKVTLDLNSFDMNNITKSNYNNFSTLAYCYFSGYSLEEIYGVC